MSTEEKINEEWIAVMSDRDGFVYATVAEAIESLGEDEEVEIAVVRGTAKPASDRRPGTYQSGDLAYEIECYLVDPDDPAVGADVRYAQAKSMAAGLNQSAAKALRDFADFIDRGPTFVMPPSIFSAMARERADDLEASR